MSSECWTLAGIIHLSVPLLEMMLPPLYGGGAHHVLCHRPGRTESYICQLNGVLSGPLACGGLVAGTVGLVDVCNLGNERIVRVGVGQHGADGKEDCMLGLACVVMKFVFA